MLRISWNSESGMRGSQHVLQTTAHNIANVNTDGYRSRRSEFTDALYTSLVELNPRVLREPLDGPEFEPMQIQRGSGVQENRITVSEHGGPLRQTDRATDMAVVGDGYLPLGDTDGELVGYTRKGEFHFDADGYLVHTSGNYLLTSDEQLVSYPEDLSGEFIVDPSGQMFVEGGEGDEPLGQLDLTIPDEGQQLVPQGGDIYGIVDTEGEDVEGQSVQPGGEHIGSIQQGYLEASNVDLGQQMVNLMMAQRGYQLNSRALQTADQMYEMANNMHH